MHFDNKTEFTLVTAILWYWIRQVQLYAQLNYTSRLIVTWDMQLPWCSGQKSLCTLTLGHTASAVAVKVCFKVNYYKHMHTISTPLSLFLPFSLFLSVWRKQLHKIRFQNLHRHCSCIPHVLPRQINHPSKYKLWSIAWIKKGEKKGREILFLKNINFVWSKFLCLPILVSIWYNIWSWLCKYSIEADTL